MTEVLKAPKPSPAKTDSCNPFHNRTQDRTKECENCTVLDLGISKDREWVAKAKWVGLLKTYCAGKRPRTGWSTRLSILKKTLRDATLRLCQRSQLTLPPLYRPTWLTTRSSNDRWEVAADIQTGEQYSSTMIWSLRQTPPRQSPPLAKTPLRQKAPSDKKKHLVNPPSSPWSINIIPS